MKTDLSTAITPSWLEHASQDEISEVFELFQGSRMWIKTEGGSEVPFIFLIGASGTGKDELAKGLGKYGYSKIMSYTTRPMRSGEYERPTHYHISSKEMQEFKDKKKLCMYTNFDGHEYGALKGQLYGDDIAVIDPDGFMNLDLSHWKTHSRSILVVYLTAAEETRRERMRERGDDEAYIKKRLEHDRKVFGENMLDTLSWNTFYSCRFMRRRFLHLDTTYQTIQTLVQKILGQCRELAPHSNDVSWDTKKWVVSNLAKIGRFSW